MVHGSSLPGLIRQSVFFEKTSCSSRKLLAKRMDRRIKSGHDECACVAHACDTKLVILRESGGSSTPRLLGSIIGFSDYWIARSSRAMTWEFDVLARDWISNCQNRHCERQRSNPSRKQGSKNGLLRRKGSLAQT